MKKNILRKMGFENNYLLYVVGLVFMFLGALATGVQPLIVGQVTGHFTDGNGVDTTALWVLVFIFTIDALSSLLSKLFLGWSSERFVYNLRVGFSEAVISTDVEHLQKFDKGDINNRFVEDIPLAQQPYFDTYPNLINSVIVSAICAVGLFVSSWQLGLAVLLIFAVSGLIVMIVLVRVETSAAASRKADSYYSSFLYESLYNFLPLKAIKSEPWALGHLRARAGQAQSAGRRLIGWNALVLPTINIATQVSLVLVILGGGYLVAQGVISFAALATFLLFLAYMISPLVSIATVLGDLKEAKVSQGRLAELLRGVPDTRYYTINPNIRVERVPEGQVSLTVAPFSYRYADGQQINYPQLSVQGPTFLALKGKNGSGKTTLLNLMSGVRGGSPGTGESADFGVHGVSNQVYYLPQERDIFTTTVRDNILLGLDKTDEDILAAADKIGVRGLIESLPAGLDTKLGVDEYDLSGGQKQIIYVLNMILADRDILLLDEFTSNIDAGTRQSIIRYIESAANNKLIIVVSHDSEVTQGAREEMSL